MDSSLSFIERILQKSGLKVVGDYNNVENMQGKNPCIKSD